MVNQIILAPLEESDLDWLLSVEADAREEGFIRGNDRAGHKHYMDEPQMRYLLILQRREKVGFVVLKNIDTKDRDVELARIIISQKGQGIGQAAVCEIVRYIFENLGAHRISLDTLSYNKRAQHVYRKLGFTQEGLIREALYLNGVFHDVVLFGLLAADWQKRGKQ